MQCHAPMTLILTMILTDREQKTVCFLILGLKRLGVFRFNQKTLCFEVLGLKLNVEKNSDPSSTHDGREKYGQCPIHILVFMPE